MMAAFAEDKNRAHFKQSIEFDPASWMSTRNSSGTFSICW